eukprot:GHVN01045802.1.p4 GENE.GHVN01045802.1~~GHVN01045802.1.p4  ORF type:complete len:117 (+),score=23.54 GHVN01045802.1:1044-1394(+)
MTDEMGRTDDQEVTGKTDKPDPTDTTNTTNTTEKTDTPHRKHNTSYQPDGTKRTEHPVTIRNHTADTPDQTDSPPKPDSTGTATATTTRTHGQPAKGPLRGRNAGETNRADREDAT